MINRISDEDLAAMIEQYGEAPEVYRTLLAALTELREWRAQDSSANNLHPPLSPVILSKVETSTFCPKCREWHRIEPETVATRTGVTVHCECGESYPVTFA